MKLNIFSKIANNEKLADTLVYVGIFGSCVCNMLAISAAYLRGIRRGVDTRDAYYEKEQIDGRK